LQRNISLRRAKWKTRIPKNANKTFFDCPTLMKKCGSITEEEFLLKCQTKNRLVIQFEHGTVKKKSIVNLEKKLFRFLLQAQRTNTQLLKVFINQLRFSVLFTRPNRLYFPDNATPRKKTYFPQPLTHTDKLKLYYLQLEMKPPNSCWILLTCWSKKNMPLIVTQLKT
jgi:hypothetical protein